MRERATEMKFAQMFMDDNTGQLSLGRVAAALILVSLILYDGHIMATKGLVLDLPTNWLAAMLGFYYGNKASSTVTTMTEIKNGAK